MWKTRLLLGLTVSLLAGCGTSGPATEPAPQIVTRTRIVDTGCDWTKPIYISKADVLTDATAEQIEAHNLTGKTKCGWKPRQKSPTTKGTP